jgi:uncharacterized Zn finger protein
MDILHREKNICDICGEKFEKYNELISHAVSAHHHPIVRCPDCGKEFIHEKDRLHHTRQEHRNKVEAREHKNPRKTKGAAPQQDVDEQTRNFGDNF